MKNIYLDFDRTIYNTDLLYSDMDKVIQKYGIDKKLFDETKKKIFKEPILFDYFKVINYICDHHKLSLQVISDLKNIINNGNKYIYDDVDIFIRQIKKEGYNVNILTYGDMSFQLKKLSNLDICDIIDNIFIVSDYKFNLELDYKNSIFIDDNPRDLEGLCNRMAWKVIRISRNNTKYAKMKVENEIIENYDSLSKLNINEISLKGVDKNE